MVKKSNWTIEDDTKLIHFVHRGYYAREIAKKLNRTKGGVDKRIQKFKREGIVKELSDLDRKRRRIENREIRKAVNRENSNFLSNKATIKACMSAYRNNSRGDLVLDINKSKEEGFAYSWDMPRASVNEEIREFNKYEEVNKCSTLKGEVNKIMDSLESLKKEVREGIEKISI